MIAPILAAVLLVVLLSACTSGSSPSPSPAPTPVPAPHDPPIPPAPLPPTVLFQSDFSQPSIGLKLAITQDTPVFVVAPDDGIYGTFDRTGSAGDDCVDPGPNAYYHTADGVLYLHAASPGYPVCTKRAFALKPGITLGMEANIAAVATPAGAWGGLVCYNGEANWIALYASEGPAGNYYWRVWGVTEMSDPVYGPVPHGEFCSVGIYYRDGVFTFRVNDREFGNPLAPMVLSHDPHCAVFVGDIDLAVHGITVWEQA